MLHRRIGAVHSVVFGGFAAKELATRIKHAEPKVNMHFLLTHSVYCCHTTPPRHGVNESKDLYYTDNWLSSLTAKPDCNRIYIFLKPLNQGNLP